MKIKASVLLDMINKTSFAMAEDNRRQPNLQTLLIERHSGTLRMVATDGHRLAICDKPVQGLKFSKRVALIERRRVESFGRLLAGKDEIVELLFTQFCLTLRVGRIERVAILSDQIFPDYKNVLPEGIPDDSVIINRVTFADAIKYAWKTPGEIVKGVICLEFTGHTLLVSSINKFWVDKIATSIINEPKTIGFDPQYLLDVLEVLDTESIVVELRDPKGVMLIHPTEKVEGGKYIYLLMPKSLQ